jgi:hypothetical protein
VQPIRSLRERIPPQPSTSSMRTTRRASIAVFLVAEGGKTMIVWPSATRTPTWTNSLTPESSPSVRDLSFFGIYVTHVPRERRDDLPGAGGWGSRYKGTKLYTGLVAPPFQ